MLKTFAVALFAIVMSVELAYATHAHKPMMAARAEGQQATARDASVVREPVPLEQSARRANGATPLHMSARSKARSLGRQNLLVTLRVAKASVVWRYSPQSAAPRRG
jgi:hypothetical protein